MYFSGVSAVRGRFCSADFTNTMSASVPTQAQPDLSVILWLKRWGKLGEISMNLAQSRFFPELAAAFFIMNYPDGFKTYL